MSISLVAGLGNPGREYETTRHNLGWFVLDAFVRQQGLVWKQLAQFEALAARWDRPGLPTCHFLKPLTYVNESGRSVGDLARYYKLAPESVAAVYDDVNIDLGLIKITTTGSAGGHNGVASLLEQLGGGFCRYRLGIGPKQPAQMDLKDFVLGKFSSDQFNLIERTLPHYLNGLDLLLTDGPDRAMNLLNRRDNNEPEQP
jgi:PTH1 family peptidyl-tRNA hydrolase